MGVYIVILPEKKTKAFYKEVDKSLLQKEGYVLNREYFEPIEEYVFEFTNDEEKAKRMIQSHYQKWS